MLISIMIKSVVQMSLAILCPIIPSPRLTLFLEGSTEGRKTCIKDVITPIGVIHEKLVQARVLKSRRREVAKEQKVNKGYCQYHIEVQGHVIQECTKF